MSVPGLQTSVRIGEIQNFRGNGGMFLQGVQAGELKADSDGRRWGSRHRSEGAIMSAWKTWTVMSAYPRDSSNTKLSSRRSDTCLLCHLFSCPPPRRLEDRRKDSDRVGGANEEEAKWDKSANWQILFGELLVIQQWLQVVAMAAQLFLSQRWSRGLHYHGNTAAAQAALAPL